ncbi:hypothetical protein [Capsulimonas corticalis]|uniref:hypothetical protein n=1 Tax=Capsulimonas corticalis TaxID=2219043 RepID=UPI000E65421E|nr:hypothetical protein [Capsulimonas corticalis]
MRRRAHSILWLLVVLAIALQSVAPRLAFAQVSVRCAGATAASKPCMQAVLPITSDTPAQMKCANMACCRNRASLLRACRMGMSMPPAHLAGRSLHTVAAPSTCLISIKRLSAAAPAARNMRRWLLDASPAAAPPTPSASSITCPVVARNLPLPSSVSLSTRYFHLSHGLRAPPVA